MLLSRRELAEFWENALIICLLPLAVAHGDRAQLEPLDPSCKAGFSSPGAPCRGQLSSVETPADMVPYLILRMPCTWLTTELDVMLLVRT